MFPDNNDIKGHQIKENCQLTPFVSVVEQFVQHVPLLCQKLMLSTWNIFKSIKN